MLQKMETEESQPNGLAPAQSYHCGKAPSAKVPQVYLVEVAVFIPDYNMAAGPLYGRDTPASVERRHFGAALQKQLEELKLLLGRHGNASRQLGGNLHLPPEEFWRLQILSDGAVCKHVVIPLLKDCSPKHESAVGLHYRGILQIG